MGLGTLAGGAGRGGQLPWEPHHPVLPRRAHTPPRVLGRRLSPREASTEGKEVARQGRAPSRLPERRREAGTEALALGLPGGELPFPEAYPSLPRASPGASVAAAPIGRGRDTARSLGTLSPSLSGTGSGGDGAPLDITRTPRHTSGRPRRPERTEPVNQACGGSRGQRASPDRAGGDAEPGLPLLPQSTQPQKPGGPRPAAHRARGRLRVSRPQQGGVHGRGPSWTHSASPGPRARTQLPLPSGTRPPRAWGSNLDSWPVPAYLGAGCRPGQEPGPRAGPASSGRQPWCGTWGDVPTGGL